MIGKPVYIGNTVSHGAVEEWEAEHGSLTDEEMDEARRRVGPSSRPGGRQGREHSTKIGASAVNFTASSDNYTTRHGILADVSATSARPP